MNILLVEDHRIVRELIGFMIDNDDRFEISAHASSVEEAREFLQNKKVDIAIVDLSLPGENGMQLLEYMSTHYKHVKILVLTMYVNIINVNKAIKLGVKGFLAKEASLDELKNALEAVASNETYFNSQITDLLINTLTMEDRESSLLNKINDLSVREKQILSLVVEGKSNHEIAEQLFISIRTVENHRAHILKKTEAKNFFELAKVALENKHLT